MSSVTGVTTPARPQSRLPGPRGPITDHLFTELRRPLRDLRWTLPPQEDDGEDDLQLALYCCYELHYGGLHGVDPRWEWEPSLLLVRRQLEDRFLERLEAMTGPVEGDPATVVPRLWQMAGGDGGPSLSSWVADHAGLDHVRELAIHRSAYQLKEADPHTWGIPRLLGEPKAAMVAIQTDEYGGGVAGRMHATLFARTMRAVGLDPGADYLESIPGLTLATTNLVSMLGLHRRWRGALVGHLALFEMTSVRPMTRYAQALRRLGVTESGCEFYDVHVEADQVHQHLAASELVGGLLRHEPALAGDILFGAAALRATEARFSDHLLTEWKAGQSSLRPSENSKVVSWTRSPCVTGV